MNKEAFFEAWIHPVRVHLPTSSYDFIYAV